MDKRDKEFLNKPQVYTQKACAYTEHIKPVASGESAYNSIFTERHLELDTAYELTITLTDKDTITTTLKVNGELYGEKTLKYKRDFEWAFKMESDRIVGKYASFVTTLMNFGTYVTDFIKTYFADAMELEPKRNKIEYGTTEEYENARDRIKGQKQNK